jgi:hypothetical protein
MASSTQGISRGMGMAVATAVTGVVLAGGVSVASLAGWIGPAQAVSNRLQASAPEQTNLLANTSATPQVVLVPIAPVTTSAQQPATTVSLAGAETTARPSIAGGAFGTWRHTEDGRSEGARVPHEERADD